MQIYFCTVLDSLSQPEDPSKFKMLLFLLLFFSEAYRIF